MSSPIIFSHYRSVRLVRAGRPPTSIPILLVDNQTFRQVYCYLAGINNPEVMAKILVIDDDDSFRSTLVATLGKHGFEVFQALGGAKGVQLARDLQPDLILCDVHMAGADGRLTLYALRRDPKVGSLPFILMSGNSLTAEALPGTGRGADGFLLKPFTQEKLLTTIGSCLDKVQPPNYGVQPAAVINNETCSTSLREALLRPLEQKYNVKTGKEKTYGKLLC